MLGDYLNQSITLKSKTTVDAYNQATYTTSTIKARFEYKRKMVTDKTGQQVISEAQCYTTTQVKPDDVITYDGVDRPVISAQDCVGIDGTVMFYEVML
jgi:hypothetical protein